MDLVPAVQRAKVKNTNKQQGHAQELDMDRWNPDGKDEWFMLGSLHGWRAVQEKANSQNATFGVLSALLLTLSFPLFISAPDFMAFADDDGLSPSGVDSSKVSSGYRQYQYAISYHK